MTTTGSALPLGDDLDTLGGVTEWIGEASALKGILAPGTVILTWTCSNSNLRSRGQVVGLGIWSIFSGIETVTGVRVSQKGGILFISSIDSCGCDNMSAVHLDPKFGHVHKLTFLPHASSCVSE